MKPSNVSRSEIGYEEELENLQDCLLDLVNAHRGKFNSLEEANRENIDQLEQWGVTRSFIEGHRHLYDNVVSETLCSIDFSDAHQSTVDFQEILEDAKDDAMELIGEFNHEFSSMPFESVDDRWLAFINYCGFIDDEIKALNSIQSEFESKFSPDTLVQKITPQQLKQKVLQFTASNVGIFKTIEAASSAFLNTLSEKEASQVTLSMAFEFLSGSLELKTDSIEDNSNMNQQTDSKAKNENESQAKEVEAKKTSGEKNDQSLDLKNESVPDKKRVSDGVVVGQPSSSASDGSLVNENASEDPFDQSVEQEEDLKDVDEKEVDEKEVDKKDQVIKSSSEDLNEEVDLSSEKQGSSQSSSRRSSMTLDDDFIEEPDVSSHTIDVQTSASVESIDPSASIDLHDVDSNEPLSSNVPSNELNTDLSDESLPSIESVDLAIQFPMDYAFQDFLRQYSLLDDQSFYELMNELAHQSSLTYFGGGQYFEANWLKNSAHDLYQKFSHLCDRKSLKMDDLFGAILVSWIAADNRSTFLKGQYLRSNDESKDLPGDSVSLSLEQDPSEDQGFVDDFDLVSELEIGEGAEGFSKDQPLEDDLMSPESEINEFSLTIDDLNEAGEYSDMDQLESEFEINQELEPDLNEGDLLLEDFDGIEEDFHDAHELNEPLDPDDIKIDESEPPEPDLTDFDSIDQNKMLPEESVIQVDLPVDEGDELELEDSISLESRPLEPEDLFSTGLTGGLDSFMAIDDISGQSYVLDCLLDDDLNFDERWKKVCLDPSFVEWADRFKVAHQLDDESFLQLMRYQFDSVDPLAEKKIDDKISELVLGPNEEFDQSVTLPLSAFMDYLGRQSVQRKMSLIPLIPSDLPPLVTVSKKGLLAWQAVLKTSPSGKVSFFHLNTGRKARFTLKTLSSHSLYKKWELPIHQLSHV